jgi:hypothetical protein
VARGRAVVVATSDIDSGLNITFAMQVDEDAIELSSDQKR